MASAAPSPLASSKEKTNGAKLSRLLIDGGTTVLRTVFNHFYHPANLLAGLNANYVTLDNLRRRRVLHKPQWELLFPPSGAAPDSNTFDITLLFLLLTNICGLSPPPSGWHAQPLPSDTSFEANLAHIKFFRNKLYGHVTTTSVDTPTFSALWLEIRTVLVALGFDQAEIDRLKAERCGEEDYIDALLEWADSEEDIKSQLKDMCQAQTKVQQTVDEVYKTQLEDHGILQENKMKLEEVHQVQTVTQQTVDKVRKAQLEDREILQENKLKLEEVHQVQTKTQQSMGEVHKAQLEDREILQDSKLKLEEVHQGQNKTEQTLGEVHKAQLEDRKILQDSKLKLEEVHQGQNKTEQTLGEVHKAQLEDRRILQESKVKLEEVHQVQNKTEQTLGEVHKAQLEDREILQESKLKLEEVHQVQTVTQQTMGEVHKAQLEDREILQESKVKLEEVHQGQTVTQQTVGEVHKAQLEDREILQESKVKLEEVHQVQTVTQQTMGEVHKAQLEDREILQESKVKLEEVHQVQTETQQTVGEVHKAQLEDHGILQYSKGKLEEVQQFQTITQETIDKVRQNQLEDRKTIQDNNMNLQQVLQIDSEMHQAVADVRETQVADSRAIQQLCQNTKQGGAKLHEVYRTLQATKSKVDELSQSHRELLKTQQQFKQAVENLEGQRERQRQEEILEKLAKIDTQRIIKQHAEKYVEGTRMFFFENVKSWLDDRSSQNRVMVISGNPGMGKSVISAVTCQKMLGAGRLAGSHFCQHDKARHRNPKVMLQSLASHLADSLPAYKNALAEKLLRNPGVEINDMEVKDLFELLFEEPLASLDDPDMMYLMVIDGIDESEYQGRNELLDMIADYFKKLPSWIRFLVTTRPEINIANRLECLQPFQLEPNNEENLKDIRLCFQEQLLHVLPSDNQDIILEALVQKSEGVILFAHYLIDLIKKEATLTPELLDSTLPSGIFSVYQSYFERLETDFCKELKITEDLFMSFLSAVAAAREPLPLGFVSKLLKSGSSKSMSVVLRKVNTSIACVSALLPVKDGCIHFFHKSVKDWLIGNSNYKQHQFIVDENEGHHVLSKHCIDELDDAKRKGVDGRQFSDTLKYSLQHGVQHLLQLEEDVRVCSLDDVVKKYCLDLELVYAKLCVDVTAASEDILSVQKQEGALPFEEQQSNPRTLLYLLRKHVNLLKQLPQAIFQILLNEGGRELYVEASKLLETRYSEVPYMEYLHKKDLKGFVQTKFECSSEVICFDVSPQLDYMACECTDGTIQLWSLHTGKLVWTKRRTQGSFNSLFRILESFSICADSCGGYLAYYRSLVFHPTKDLVLPGILSHAYTFDGDLKPLFPSSKCHFSVCSVSADKAKLLTDCPNNAKTIIIWSLTDGLEITHLTWNEDILSFAWSRDGSLIALSDSSSSIFLVDAIHGFKTLAKRDTRRKCGMIKFSPDCQFLFCLFLSVIKVYYHSELFCSQVRMENECSFSLCDAVDLDYRPWEDQSCSEPGFMLGDPFCKVTKHQKDPDSVFVLNEKSVLRASLKSSVIEMLHPDSLTKDTDATTDATLPTVVFSMDGSTLYVFTFGSRTPTVRTWKVSSEELKGGKRINIQHDLDNSFFRAAVRTGFLFEKTSYTLSERLEQAITLELWNFEVSECIQSWTDITGRVYPISEERVACVHHEYNDDSEMVQDQVNILNTTNGDIVSTVVTDGRFVACNSRSQVIVWKTDCEHCHSLEMHNGQNVLWEHPLQDRFLGSVLSGTFSPTEKYCVISAYFLNLGRCDVFVVDAVLGRRLHELCHSDKPIICKFVSDEECVINGYDHWKDYHCVRMFNVKSGDLLSEITMESEVFSLAVCHRERLLAIGLIDTQCSFMVLKVELPREKDDKKNKRTKPQK